MGTIKPEDRKHRPRNGGHTKCGVHPDHPRYKYYARIQRRYKLTLDGFHARLELQNGCCALCGDPFSGKTIVVDHDHGCCGPTKDNDTCGECVRGLVCMHCNTGLSVVERVGHDKIVAYLPEWK